MEIIIRQLRQLLIKYEQFKSDVEVRTLITVKWLKQESPAIILDTIWGLVGGKTSEGRFGPVTQGPRRGLPHETVKLVHRRGGYRNGEEVTLKPNKHNHCYGICFLLFSSLCFPVSSLAFVTSEPLISFSGFPFRNFLCLLSVYLLQFPLSVLYLGVIFHFSHYIFSCISSIQSCVNLNPPSPS